jgi:hypothetical protein
MTNELSNKFNNPDISRQYKKWTINECLQLQREYMLLELSPYEIAMKHKRTVPSIAFKIAQEVRNKNYYASDNDDDDDTDNDDTDNDDTDNDDTDNDDTDNDDTDNDADDTDDDADDTDDETDDADTDDTDDDNTDNDEKTQLLENYTNKYNTTIFRVLTTDDFIRLIIIYLCIYDVYLVYTCIWSKIN